MNNKFDELTKSLAQSVSRRAAFKKFGVGFAGMVLACFGMANKAEANPGCLPTGAHCDLGDGKKYYPSCKKCCSGGGSPRGIYGWYCD